MNVPFSNEFPQNESEVKSDSFSIIDSKSEMDIKEETKPTQPVRDAKRTHKEEERRRRKTWKDGLERLRLQIPHLSTKPKRVSALHILLDTKKMIEALEEQKEMIKGQNQDLVKKIEQMNNNKES